MNTGAGEAVGWRELREFAGVDIDQSFVLSWSLDRDLLILDVDLKLRAEHPFYEPPRRREKGCMRPGSIEFPCCVQVRHEGVRKGSDAASVVRKLRAGAIRDLVRRDAGPYLVTGTFGSVEIDAERPLLRLRDT